MRLFVIDKITKQKVYLDLNSPTRLALFQKLGAEHLYVNDKNFHLSEVLAEPGSNSSITGAVSGSLIGALGGPIGIIIGLGVGTLIGSGVQQEENTEVNTFNESQFYYKQDSF